MASTQGRDNRAGSEPVSIICFWSADDLPSYNGDVRLATIELNGSYDPYVSIRIDYPGSDGALVQLNRAELADMNEAISMAITHLEIVEEATR